MHPEPIHHHTGSLPHEMGTIGQESLTLETIYMAARAFRGLGTGPCSAAG